MTKYTLIGIAVIAAVISGSVYFFVTRGNSAFHENWRMNKVARILEEHPEIIKAYGSSCSVRRLESGHQMAAVINMAFHHVSTFEITTSNGPKTLSVKWYGLERGLFVGVEGFEEVADTNPFSPQIENETEQAAER